MPPKKEKGHKEGQNDKKKDGRKHGNEQALLNEQLTQEVANLKAELEAKQALLLSISKKLLESKDQKWKTEHKIQTDADLLPLGEIVFLEIIGNLIVKKKEYEESVELQAERLEKRVTEMSLELARYKTKCQAYEDGLKGFLICDNLNSIRDHVYHLMVIAGEAYHSCEANDPERDLAKLFGIEGITDRPGNETKRVIDFANKLDLIPPSKKYAGDTLIKDIVPELLLYIIKELSMEKASGADWRTLGCRVGIDEVKLDNWNTSKLSYPAGRVFTEWLMNCPATVRLLYRHLMSPQMRCTVLCKRIADFYDIA